MGIIYDVKYSAGLIAICLAGGLSAACSHPSDNYVHFDSRGRYLPYYGSRNPYAGEPFTRPTPEYGGMDNYEVNSARRLAETEAGAVGVMVDRPRSGSQRSSFPTWVALGFICFGLFWLFRKPKGSR